MNKTFKQDKIVVRLPEIRSLGKPILPVLIAFSLLGNSWDISSQTGAGDTDIGASRKISQLSERGRRLIREIRKARQGKDERSDSERCVDEEVGRLGRSPSNLEWRVIDLKCREIGGPSVVPEE
jgi:hypothetical protein